MDNEFENKYYADDKMGKEYVNKILAKNARGIINSLFKKNAR